MSWEEQLKGITIGTLFRFFGRTLVAGILWTIIFYAIVLIPMVIVMAVTSAW
jgi:hypothetical protein